MKQFILLTFLFSLISCSKNQKVDQISRESELSIITYGAPWENQFQAIYNPVEISKDTLFVSKIKNNFNLNERKSRVLDGTSVSVSISNNTSAVHFSYKGLKKAENADPEIEKLIKFINTKLPNKFQIY